jgi:hypothetical protein
MAGAPKADDIPNGPPLAKFIDLPECLHPGKGRSLPSSQISKEHHQLVIKIRNILATNTAVVVNGWTPDLQTDFSVDGVDIYRSFTSHMVSWQGALCIWVEYIILMKWYSPQMLQFAQTTSIRTTSWLIFIKTHPSVNLLSDLMTIVSVETSSIFQHYGQQPQHG